jgi:Beta-galactosidase
VRVPIAVQVKPFDIDKAQPQIDATREAFAGYLKEVRQKSSRSKHGLMGPVGKILSEVKSGRRDPASLKGYAVRVHEATGGYPSPGSLEALEKGIDTLVKLLDAAPVTVHDRLLDRLDYGLYFDLRKKFLSWIEDRDRDFRSWLQKRYASLDLLNQQWGKQIDDWTHVRFGGSSSQTYKKASLKQRGDMEEFQRFMKEAGKSEIADIDEEDE